MVQETHLYATQILLKTDAGRRSRLNDWYPTDRDERKRFIGLIGSMGQVKVPRLANYWSKHKLFFLPTPKSAMSRNRFELLLRIWHFADNEQAVQSNRLYKIENNLNFKFPRHLYTWREDMYRRKGSSLEGSTSFPAVASKEKTSIWDQALQTVQGKRIYMESLCLCGKRYHRWHVSNWKYCLKISTTSFGWG